MSTGKKILIALLVIVLILAGLGFWLTRGNTAEVAFAKVTGIDPELTKPKDETFPTIDIAKPIGWAANEAPTPASGLAVSRFAEGLDHPRTMITLPNGDVLVALTRAPATSDNNDNFIVRWITGHMMRKAGAAGKSPNEIVLLRDTTSDGKADQRFVLSNKFDSPSGMAWRDGTLYVADHNALLSFPYKLGDTTLAWNPTKLMDLAPGGNHWMRNIVLSPDGTKLYVAVGSATNIADHGLKAEEGRALIWEYDLNDHQQRIFGAGMRNPNGLAFSPWTDELWTTVNERDMTGPDLVPDYLTNVPVGVHYGWPWVYWKNIIDDRVTAPMPQFLTSYTRKPEYALGPHVAALGLVFTEGGARLGSEFDSGAFVAEHGSWNRKPPSGYDVVYIPFDARGNPKGKPVPVLTGFLTGKGQTHGRPTWLTWAKDGALLVSDDTAGIIWRVIKPGAAADTAIKQLKGPPLPPQKELHGDMQATIAADQPQ